MFFQDCVSALSEVHRVLKPDARACFVAWGAFEQPYWRSMMGVVIKHVGGPALTPGGPNPFKFSQTGSLSSVLRQAGFREIDEQIKQVPWTWPGTAEEVWEQARAISTPFLPLLERVPASKWNEINREVYQEISRYREGDSIKFGAVVVLASGKKN